MIKVESITKVFKGKTQETVAVDAVSYAFAPGKSYAITGPSGCGKTTLLNMIWLILAPTAGQLRINGECAGGLSQRVRAQYRNRFFGYIAQNFLLNDEESVCQNVRIPLLYAQPKITRREQYLHIETMLGKVGLSEKLHQPAGELSGGQMQRAAIARSLINEPQVILADEPTGALDSKTGNDVIALLESIVQEGKTLIMVTHNEALARRCDIQIRMLDGRIIA